MTYRGLSFKEGDGVQIDLRLLDLMRDLRVPLGATGLLLRLLTRWVDKPFSIAEAETAAPVKPRTIRKYVRALEAAGLIERCEGGYQLSDKVLPRNEEVTNFLLWLSGQFPYMDREEVLGDPYNEALFLQHLGKLSPLAQSILRFNLLDEDEKEKSNGRS